MITMSIILLVTKLQQAQRRLLKLKRLQSTTKAHSQIALKSQFHKVHSHQKVQKLVLTIVQEQALIVHSQKRK